VNATVEEAVRLGADAVGYTLYVGRNVFQRDRDESLRLVAQLKEILAKYPS
jgi:DhnA family fructose-bisphosphate aldolase class Ia